MDDLKWIKKHYGEEMMHLCRELFPILLEEEGLLSKLLEEHIVHNRHFAEDVKEYGAEDDFKNYIYSFTNLDDGYVHSSELKSAKELLASKGYILFPECKREDEIQSFKKYYARKEELCTFRGGRLNTCRVWFAVKENALDLDRTDFVLPERQDEYGTSVISIQFARKNDCLSIKNRYNHTVFNPDCTFNNNLDNIVPGLTEAFERDFGVRDRLSPGSNAFDLPNYVCIDDKYYHYNYLKNDVYYCDNNVIIDNRQGELKVIKLPQNQILVDWFVVDVPQKKIGMFDECSYDTFPRTIGEIENISYKDKHFVISVAGGEDVTIDVDDRGRIKGLKNNNITRVGDFFLSGNEVLENVEMSSLKYCGDYFLETNLNLKEIDFSRLKSCGDGFLLSNMDIDDVWLPLLGSCGEGFLRMNYNLKQLSLPNLRDCGDNFLFYNRNLRQLFVPKLRECGDNFCFHNRTVSELSFPSLERCYDGFFHDNEIAYELEVPNLRDFGADCFASNPNFRDFEFLEDKGKGLDDYSL